MKSIEVKVNSDRENNMIKIVISGEPVAKKSVRVIGNRAYNPNKEYMDAIKAVLRSKVDFKPSCMPVSMHTSFYFPVKKLGRDPSMMMTKPDISNLLKLYEDCLSGITYRDDSQITKIESHKARSIVPRTEICLIFQEDDKYCRCKNRLKEHG